MMKQLQTTLLTANRAKVGLSTRHVRVQVVLGLVLIASVFGVFAMANAVPQEASSTSKGTHFAATNVLPQLVISPESLKPNLNGMLATGDGGASLPLEEVVAGVSRGAFNDLSVHAKSSTQPNSTR